MELWVALDSCATHQHSMLKDYEPGFPPSLFNPMLLPQRIQMERLARVEQYIKQRISDSKYSSSFVFQDSNKPNSFAIRYYEQSPNHQGLRREIEAEATHNRIQKNKELEDKRQEHRRLMQKHNSLDHEEVSNWNGYRDIISHPYYCQKCRLKREADGLEITVHEWPLPYVELEAISAVFELNVPTGIAGWRDMTYTLLVDIFSPESRSESSESKLYPLHDFSGLTRYVQCQTGRLQLVSVAKPFVVSHYRSKKIPAATEDNICVPNGLHYSMYDSNSNQWTNELLNQCDVRRACTFQLPPGSYQTLQYALNETSHTSNEVLARQSRCPTALNIHEFYAFSTLRAGHRLQWRNIARELIAYILNFSHEETYLLLAQAAWQVSYSGDVGLCRESHVDLEEEEFGLSLLSVLDDALGTVEGNWQGAVAVRTFVLLASRLLSLSPHGAVQNGCYLFLRRSRSVTLHWTRDVGRLLQEEQNAGELDALNLRALEMALTCHGTCDVDQSHLSALLRSNEDIGTLTECCIFIHDRSPGLTQNLPLSLQMLLRRFERLSHFIEPALRRHILRDQNGIDCTIQRVWAGYRVGTPWAALSQPDDRWLTTETAAGGDCNSMTVHYNILNGSLLINGLPLTRLPRSYELHDTYRRLFGEKVLDVVPSTMTAMLFETRVDIDGKQVHFRMHGTELIIRTRNQQQVSEMIPIHALRDDFTRAFVEDYAHWLDTSTGVIEWRPLKSAWTASPNNWQMRPNGHKKFVLSHAAKKVIDVRSPTARMISQLLSPLEHATHIHIILNCGTGALELHLPRMKLDFLLKGPQYLLQSKQFRGMVVDKQQSFGAFTGLVNKLVLREDQGTSRCVVVPHGEVSFSPEDYHVRVQIDTTSADHVKYHSYQIDSQLGRLIDNGSLQSRLFKFYLHATTSHCVLDELTGRTGTEEALYGLASAATRSFVKLEPADIELLEKLARLTPRRLFYPRNLQVMQQVQWNTLSPLSQHCAFYKHAASILDQARSFQIFLEASTPLPKKNAPDQLYLLERASIRDSSFQVHDFGAAAFTVDHDRVYDARDQAIDSTRELTTCRMAKLVDEWSTDVAACPRLLSEIESWAQPIRGPSREDDLTIGFDLSWLDVPSKFLPECWSTLCTFLSHSMVERDKYKILVLLSTLSYSPHAKQELIQTLLAFATVPQLRMLKLPCYPVFQLTEGYTPVLQRLVSLIEGHVRQFHDCPEYHLPPLHGEKEHFAEARRKLLYKHAKEERTRMLARDLMTQWPTANIRTPTDTVHNTYILVGPAMEDARVMFQSWHRNAEFRRHIQQTQTSLDSLTPEQQHHLQMYSFSPPADLYTPRQTRVEFADLTHNSAPVFPTLDQWNYDEWIIRGEMPDNDYSKLRQLLDYVPSQCSTAHKRQYVKDLLKSFKALPKNTSVKLGSMSQLMSLIDEHLRGARNHVAIVYQTICDQLQASTCGIIRMARMLPRLSPISILSHLARDKIANLPSDWKVAFVHYGLSITVLQRAERLVIAASNTAELVSELENAGHQEWDPMHHPEWLLLEIENNLLIRPDQAQISEEMMSPSSGSNSVMQLNMGLGKSSLIVPIVATALADQTKLVRVIVLRALAMQMFQMLVKKLGGMLNRRIFYMPISRSLDLDLHQARQIHSLYEECMRTGGILLIQPEHILSFELMGLERLSSDDAELGNVLIKTQEWLHANSRDILDESDEILSVRFELIYTIGTQRAIEFSPERWTIIEHVLGNISRAAHGVLERFPHGLELIPGRPGQFPRIRILQNLAGDELLGDVARQICMCGLPGIPVWNLSNSVKTVLFRFLTDPNLSPSATQLLDESVFSSKSMRSGLLLLRGLFRCGILRFAFEQKRWRVNYGLDPFRTLLAVPYHAKDSPAARAEFSHPDATIVLTCLSYYYDGLTDPQIIACFTALFQFDHAQEEYECWVKDAPGIPVAFRCLSGINLSNMAQCTREVFPLLKFAKAIIDFYLSTIVFPAEMKEFPDKLSSSGWDIAQEKVHPTTGFSGTNDSKYVLPLSISQCDLPAQLSTNAAVLGCLLQPENSFVNISDHSGTGVLNAEVLLNMALSLRPPVRVILDVGAQVLELQNKEVAHEWLLRVPESEAQAAIFFDNQNEICVLSRDGTNEPLLISPFSKQMDQCLVYLDESHTRGTDLKLPMTYRAIVTLGPGLTKDRLVQACMRMRKLGKGQSVVFCSSMEIERNILDCNSKTEGPIAVFDVLKWCIAGTCVSTRRNIPLWATQGLRHQHRRAVLSESLPDAELVKSLLEPEAQSLQQRYGHGGTSHENQIFRSPTEPILLSRESQLNDIRAKCQEFEVISFDTASLQEEQERELSPENEREQQVELPPTATPCRHTIHKDVRNLITHGVLNVSGTAFRPAFETFRKTTALQHYESAAWPHDLLVSTDFAITVQAGERQFLDSFLRPVHWIISCKAEAAIKCVIISPFEAQELLPVIRRDKRVTLHVYSPRLNKSVRTLDSLSFCAIPTVLESWSTPPVSRQLNLFAGQLYIQGYEEYEMFCSFLGLCCQPPGDRFKVACDGFIQPASRVNSNSAIIQACPFMTSPVPFVRMIIALRRKGQSISVSHVGRILNGELITREQF